MDDHTAQDEADESPDRPDLTWALASARQGDQHAFTVLYNDLHPRLLHYLRALVRTDAEDVASETWLQIGRDLPTFHGSWHKWRSWAITIARNRALDHIRHQQRRPHTHIPLEQLQERSNRNDTETDVLSRLAWQTALLLITSLPRSEAEAVLLRSVMGYTATEAAHILGKQPGAIRTAAHRGLRKLTHHAHQLGLTP
ncbi:MULTISPECIES: RNA polymerase sigma factor [unclassified Spirillospora]|uniref:RNA polymerase sigma factor n=1 Tax=unclassified Spirillospora TaxID=2642701 RepID=UPI003718B7E3